MSKSFASSRCAARTKPITKCETLIMNEMSDANHGWFLFYAVPVIGKRSSWPLIWTHLGVQRFQTVDFFSMTRPKKRQKSSPAVVEQKAPQEEKKVARKPQPASFIGHLPIKQRMNAEKLTVLIANEVSKTIQFPPASIAKFSKRGFDIILEKDFTRKKVGVLSFFLCPNDWLPVCRRVQVDVVIGAPERPPMHLVEFASRVLTMKFFQECIAGMPQNTARQTLNACFRTCVARCVSLLKKSP
jgi:hypothetical protein